MFLKFHTTYEDKHDNIVKDLRHIALHYVLNRKGFMLDFIALLPYEFLALLVSDRSLHGSLALYLRLPHLVRVLRVSWVLTAEQKKLNRRQEDYSVLLRVIKVMWTIERNLYQYLDCIYISHCSSTGQSCCNY